jgi:hypothetical protein
MGNGAGWVVQGGAAPPPRQEQHVQPHPAQVLLHDGQEDGHRGAGHVTPLLLRRGARLEMCHKVTTTPQLEG